jgi:hypothetical protein
MTALATTVPNTLPIPAAYAKFGATRGFHPKPFARNRWLIKSLGGRGKSTFISSIPGCLHLDIEGGAHSVVNSEAVRIPDGETGLSYDAFNAVLIQLLADGDAAKGDLTKLPFSSVAIDTVDGMFQLYAADFCKQHNPTGKEIESIGEYGSEGSGYGLVYARMIKVLTALESRGYAIVLACHEKEKDIKVSSGGQTQTITVVRPSLGDSIAKALENRVDINAVLRFDPRIVETPGRQVTLPGGATRNLPGEKRTVHDCVMRVEATQEYDAKRRVTLFRGNIVLPLQHGWSAVKPLYDKAVSDMQTMLEAGQPIPTE